jgi:hypothetical protein
MKALNTNILIKPNGDTRDIASAVISVYNSDYSQVSELAQTLQGASIEDTCKNIFNYLLDHVNYNEDPAGVQWVKTPARLLADGSGDCKSFAIFIASCLRCLGINHCFRFVSYNQRKDATHVYVVVKTQGIASEIILDAVVRVKGLPIFNYQEKYTYKTDMNGTNIYKMAGVPQRTSNILPSAEDRYTVWIGDEHEANITPGKHYLYARFDYFLEMINIAETKQQQAYYYDHLDISASLLHSYNHVNGNTDEFKKMAFIICGMITDGTFYSSSIDDDIRADNLDNLFDEIDSRYHNDYLPTKYDAETWQMVCNEVCDHNVVLGSRVQAISGNEASTTDSIKKSGIYFLYMFIPDAELAGHTDIVKTKQTKQGHTFNWMDANDTYHTTETAKLLIRTGIVARTGKTPERYIRDLKAGKGGDIQIGALPAVLAVISAVITIIIGLVTLWKALFPPKVDKPTDKDIVDGAFDPTKDFGADGGSNVSSSSMATMILPLALGASVLFGMFKKK